MARSDPEKLAQALRANLKRRKAPPPGARAETPPAGEAEAPPEPQEKPAQP